MWFILSPTAGALLGLALIIYFIGAAGKSIVSGLASSGGDSAFADIPLHSRKSPTGEARLRYAFYYKTNNSYIASVVCEKIAASEFIEEKSIDSLEKRISETFADFDRRAAAV